MSVNQKPLKTNEYNPSGVGKMGTLFGLPYNQETGKIAIIPVPWEVTVSSGGGTSMAPTAILEESPQLDLSLYGFEKPWQCAPFMLPIDEEWRKTNKQLKMKTQAYIQWLESGKLRHSKSEQQLNHLNDYLQSDGLAPTSWEHIPNETNQACEQLNLWVKNQALQQINKGKKVGLLGGEHSCMLGLVDALRQQHPTFGILQIDAHADLRKAYQGFTYSHASTIFNVLKWKEVEQCVQVGIRDYAEVEQKVMQQYENRIVTCYDRQLKQKLFGGVTWEKICQQIISRLPEKVYITFDIDGLSPENCPNTGTAVPGGLTYDMAYHLVAAVWESGRQIIGFDLCEVAPALAYKNKTLVISKVASKINQVVGARILYYLSVFLGKKR